MNWRIPAILLLLAVFFLGNGLTSLYFQNQTQKLLEKKAAAADNLEVIDEVWRLVLGAESSQRGYLLTGSPEYLRPFEAALPEYRKLSRQLIENEISVGVPEEEEAAKKLIEDIDAKFAEMQQTIVLSRQTGEDKAVELVKSDIGFELMGDIELVIAAYRNAEFNHLDSLSRQAERSASVAFKSVLGVNLLGFVLVAVFGVLQGRAVERSERLNEKLEEANTALEVSNDRLEASNDQLEQANERLEATNEELERTNDNLEEMVEMRTRVLEDQTETLQRSNQELESFAYVASHDLQEPLRKIRAFSDRLEDRYADQLDERGRDYLARMHSASERMSTLITDLLSLSRAKSQGLVFKRVSLQKVLSMALNDLDTALREVGGQVEVPDLPDVDGDAAQLSSVFSNLLGNAIKYRSAGRSPLIKIKVDDYQASGSLPDLEPGRDYYKLSISDNGIGFDNQMKEKVFTMFQRLHGRKQYEGTGIGLAICRKIVERHNGYIHVEAVEPGAGATFALYLPTQLAEDEVERAISA